jgi:hypothetical protein
MKILDALKSSKRLDESKNTELGNLTKALRTLQKKLKGTKLRKTIKRSKSTK